MSRDSGPETGGFKYIWRIENFSKCVLEEGESLTSPKFVVADMQNTAWYLSLYPRHMAGRKEYVECYLFRDTVDGGPRSMSISYSVSFVKTKDRDNTELFQMEFIHGQFGSTFVKYHRKEIFDNRSLFLPKDTLIIECHLQKDTIFKMAKVECTATTRITVERIHFTWTIKNFLCNSVGLPENYERVIHPVTKARNPPSITIKLRFHDTDRDAIKVICQNIKTDLYLLLSS
ncbi:hypothetical protein JTE90_002791 [Oedothorax gibbosus]|uniref:MATH domain-containing protein n=1 Tax=Oedothorax gibbosus TaxID=931172 RepID=A0AAV6UHT5_9ARAC|nr:hypothetical protein JTE90_002791 [Oedothorax gibbosus]